MLRVGLTGGIACGKTGVRKLLADRGALTIDADTIVHQLLDQKTELTDRIREQFGAGVLAPDGSVDRKKLGAVVFSDPEARRRLNRLVHPRVIAEEKRLLEEAERKGSELAVVDAALMIETGTYRNYDRLVVVYCPRAAQVERLMARDGLSKEDAARRVDAQLSIEDKKPYADYVIDTSGSLEETERQVQGVWEKLRRDAARY
jgi:dephospho-CoA kinase